MGYVWVDDRELLQKENRQLLKKWCSKLIAQSLKSKLEFSLQFKNRDDSDIGVAVDACFFEKGDIKNITLYDFYSVEKNNKIMEIILKMLKTNKIDFSFNERAFD